MNLVKLRNDFLTAVAEHPLHDWPGPPSGLEGRASASYMGENTCMRKAYYRCLVAQGKIPAIIDLTPEKGGNDLPAQRGWILEDGVRHWLEMNGVSRIKVCEEPVIGPDDLYYGHPDGRCLLDGWEAILEIKHLNAMRYMDLLRSGVKAMEHSTYYAQVQAYMLATGLDQTLFIALASDPSSVKGDITWGKRRKDYQGQLEPDFLAIPNCSGVNPYVYIELIPADKPYQKSLVAWAAELADAVGNGKTPDQGFDLHSAWQCRPEWCEFRGRCEEFGPPVGYEDTGATQVERGVSRE